MADHPLRPATRLRLGELLPRQLPDGPQTTPQAIGFENSRPFSLISKDVGLPGISQPFGWLFPSRGHVIYVLLTRAPLYSALLLFAFDLHVLGTPPAFVLSQDQTLREILFHEEPSKWLSLKTCFFRTH